MRVVELGHRKLCSTCCKFGLEMPRYESFRRQETNRQKNNAANVGRGREREDDKERERGGVCVNEGQVRTEKWHLTRSAAFAYFVANCCSTGC